MHETLSKLIQETQHNSASSAPSPSAPTTVPSPSVASFHPSHMAEASLATSSSSSPIPVASSLSSFSSAAHSNHSPALNPSSFPSNPYLPPFVSTSPAVAAAAMAAAYMHPFSFMPFGVQPPFYSPASSSIHPAPNFHIEVSGGKSSASNQGNHHNNTPSSQYPFLQSLSASSSAMDDDQLQYPSSSSSSNNSRNVHSHSHRLMHKSDDFGHSDDPQEWKSRAKCVSFFRLFFFFLFKFAFNGIYSVNHFTQALISFNSSQLCFASQIGCFSCLRSSWTS